MTNVVEFPTPPPAPPAISLRAIADQAVKRALDQALESVMLNATILDPTATIGASVCTYLAAVRRELEWQEANMPTA